MYIILVLEKFLENVERERSSEKLDRLSLRSLPCLDFLQSRLLEEFLYMQEFWTIRVPAKNEHRCTIFDRT